MKKITLALFGLGAVLSASACAGTTETTTSACAPGMGVNYVCGVRNPEDLVHVPDTNWIIGSGLRVGDEPNSGGLILIDSDRRTATKLPPPSGAAVAPWDDCQSPPDATFSAHGLFLSPGQNDRHLLFVTGHSGREAVEVFDVDATRPGAPAITWSGCVDAPDGAYLNSVTVSPARDHIYVSEFYRPPLTMMNALQGQDTGGLWRWTRQTGAWDMLPGTMLPGANGVAVTDDGKYLFTAVTGSSSVMRFTIGSDAAPDRIEPGFRADNLRWAPDGRILLAGPGADPDCVPGPATSCVTVPWVGALDPETLELEILKTGPGEPDFPGTSSALIVRDELWLGSYNAQRVAVQNLD